MATKKQAVPYYLNRDRIHVIRIAEGWLTIDFDEGSTLKCPARKAVSRFGSGETDIGPPIIPDRLLTKGNKLVDGKPRCERCNCILTEDALCGHCWSCAQQTEVVTGMRNVLEYCRVSNPLDKIRKYLAELDPATDLTKMDMDIACDELLALYRSEIKLTTA